jgi:hypothetical protein
LGLFHQKVNSGTNLRTEFDLASHPGTTFTSAAVGVLAILKAS